MGAVFAIFSGFYYWFGKITGYQYNEWLGKLHFWITFIGVNITFFPMHILGLSGMPRRIPDYPDLYADLNLICSIGSLISFSGVLLWFYIVFEAFYSKKECPKNPWTFYPSYPELLIRLYKVGLRLQNKFYKQNNLTNLYILDKSDNSYQLYKINNAKNHVTSFYNFVKNNVYFILSSIILTNNSVLKLYLLNKVLGSKLFYNHFVFNHYFNKSDIEFIDDVILSNSEKFSNITSISINKKPSISHNFVSYNSNNYKINSLEWTLNSPPELHTFEKGTKVVTTNQNLNKIRDHKFVKDINEYGINISGSHYNHFIFNSYGYNNDYNLPTNTFYNSKYKDTNITIDYNDK